MPLLDKSDTPEYVPVKLIEKDRRILGALFDDARTPFSVVGKKARLSKETVAYRVKRLMDTGLLVGFNTVLDIKRMGWEVFFVYIRLRNIDAAKEKEILDYLREHPNVAQLFRCIGNYDAIIKVFVRNYAEVGAVMKQVEEKFLGSIDDCSFDYIAEEIAVPFSFLYRRGKGGLLAYTGKKREMLQLSELDLKILRVLAKAARLNFSELAAGIGSTRELVKYHVKKLEREGAILKYRPDTLPKVLGYNWYFLILKTGRLGDELEKSLSSFLLSHPNVTYFYRTAGVNDLQVELRVRTNEKLNEVLTQIRGILKGTLKRFELLTILDEPKYTYFPECLMGK